MTDSEASDRSAGGTVRVEPLGIEIDVRPGESLMRAAQRLGYRWPTACRGEGNCTLCYVTLEEGSDSTSPQAAWERERLDFMGRRDSRFRLACQLLVSGSVRVHKRGVRPPG